MKLVHPTDFSETADLALAATIRCARAFGAEVVVVHVLAEVPLYAEGLAEVQAVERVQAAQARSADEALRTRLAGIRDAGLRVRGVVRSGTAAREIVRTAEDEQADMIVMGTHGRGAFARALTGSVADRVVRTAPCAVMTVRQGARG